MRQTVSSVALSLALIGAGTGAVVHFAPPEPLVPPQGNGREPLLDFDVNADGVIDFQFIDDGRVADVRTLGDNRILGEDPQEMAVRGLPGGAFIGATPPDASQWSVSFFSPPPFSFFENRPRIISCASGGGTVCFGQYVGNTAFAGVEFDIDGQTHYGWIRIEGFEFWTRVVIHDWAYESEPGVPIRAGAIPEPSGGVLAVMGGVVLALRRRR